MTFVWHGRFLFMRNVLLRLFRYIASTRNQITRASNRVVWMKSVRVRVCETVECVVSWVVRRLRVRHVTVCEGSCVHDARGARAVLQGPHGHVRALGGDEGVRSRVGQCLIRRRTVLDALASPAAVTAHGHEDNDDDDNHNCASYVSEIPHDGG